MISRAFGCVRSCFSVCGWMPRISRPSSPSCTTPSSSSPLRAAAGPDARRLAVALVVLVEPGGDRALVVALLPRRELRDAQHDTATLASRPIYGLDDASVSRLLSRVVGGADGAVQAASSRASASVVLVLLLVVGAAPLLLAVSGVDERSVLLGGVVGGLDHA